MRLAGRRCPPRPTVPCRRQQHALSYLRWPKSRQDTGASVGQEAARGGAQKLVTLLPAAADASTPQSAALRVLLPVIARLACTLLKGQDAGASTHREASTKASHAPSALSCIPSRVMALSRACRSASLSGAVLRSGVGVAGLNAAPCANAAAAAGPPSPASSPAALPAAACDWSMRGRRGSDLVLAQACALSRGGRRTFSACQACASGVVPSSRAGVPHGARQQSS